MKRMFLVILVLALSQPVALFAQTYSSSSYQVNEATFGSGGEVDANSASYNARGSAGNLGVGEANSTTYGAFAGSITPDQEYLELNVTAGPVDLGTLTTSSTGTGTSTFYVRSYIDGSYVVKTLSTTPKNGTQSLAAMSSAAASAQGTEQFGINLVANTSPATMGAVPALQPNGSFANGIAATGYDTTNTYKYNIGDTIAQSGAGRAWGQTNFTISYIANISPVTTGGIFSVDHDIVVIPTY
jgi:hypothetical protein